MERSGNFYKAIQLGYILISILIGCMAYNSLYEWQEIEALELGNKKIDELRKEIPQIRNYAPNLIQKRKESASLVKGGTVHRMSP